MANWIAFGSFKKNQFKVTSGYTTHTHKKPQIKLLILILNSVDYYYPVRLSLPYY